MDIDQARTFLAIAAHGSFLEAAKRLHVTQSTVSARVQNLESELGAKLFVRNRAGASLTFAGQRFLQHAKSLVLTAEQARHDVGLPSRYRATVRIGGRIALWEGFLPNWVGWMRKAAPDVSIRSEIGFEEDLMRRLLEGTLDIGVMYTPSHAPGLVVEHLFDETLVMVSTSPDTRWPGEDYVYKVILVQCFSYVLPSGNRRSLALRWDERVAAIGRTPARSPSQKSAPSLIPPCPPRESV
jgi:DNA-binding transcriptional LysR family regulator